jgi:6-phosphogluconolactonase
LSDRIPHLVIGLLLAAVAVGAAAAEPLAVYVGTYTGAKSRGIYLARFDPATGELSAPELVAETASPSFLAVDPGRAMLYTVNEVDSFEGRPGGSVSAFAVDGPTGHLRLVNRVSSVGGGPCHLVIDPSGKNVLVANYGGGSVVSVPVSREGKLGRATSVIQHKGSGADPKRQAGPHTHAVGFDPRYGRFALVADLGLDKLLVYRFDAKNGLLTAHDPAYALLPAGAGPRHFVFHPDGQRVYVTNEIDLTVTAFAFAPEAGILTSEGSVSTLPGDTRPRPVDSTAEIAIHPNGRFLYVSNRGTDTIAAFSIDAKTGGLALLGSFPTGGQTPRHFAIDPSGRYLLAANQKSDSIVVFKLDPETGRLTPTGHKAEVGAPVCLVFRPAAAPPKH